MSPPFLLIFMVAAITDVDAYAFFNQILEQIPFPLLWEALFCN